MFLCLEMLHCVTDVLKDHSAFKSQELFIRKGVTSQKALIFVSMYHCSVNLLKWLQDVLSKNSTYMKM